ncbi:unnamed protein product [Mycena citricolor]|uniref:Uncharacterized protein n=1 Tax=Mycena citricolor TaxID=2018698 RepID=A0AAD2H2C8_9AGAR|nr:unnamed protein product [Mycena citricolor]
MAPSLEVAPIPQSGLPQSSPNLMPFHVEHNGAAAISTYMPIEAAPDNVAKPAATTPDAETPEIAGSRPEDTPMPLETIPTPDTATRFMTSFRGRTMHGLKVPLPQGYTGLLLNGDGVLSSGIKPSKSGVKIKPKTTGRSSRSVTRADDVEMDSDQPSTTTRTLLPVSEFSSFVLWQPDIPVDVGEMNMHDR